MVHGKNRIPYWIDRRLNGLAEPDYDATIEPEDSQYGKYRFNPPPSAFEVVGDRNRSFLGPVRDSILVGESFERNWPAGGPWQLPVNGSWEEN